MLEHFFRFINVIMYPISVRELKYALLIGIRSLSLLLLPLASPVATTPARYPRPPVHLRLSSPQYFPRCLDEEQDIDS